MNCKEGIEFVSHSAFQQYLATTTMKMYDSIAVSRL